MIRFGFGGIAAPLVGIAGALSILPLGVVATVAVLLAGAAYLLLARRPTPAAPTTSDPAPIPAHPQQLRRTHHAWSHHARARRCPGRRPRQPLDRRTHRRDHPGLSDLHLRIRPVAVPRHRPPRPHADGTRVRRRRHRDRRRREGDHDRRLRRRVVLRLRQHLRDLPGRLPVPLRARHGTRRHPGRVRPHPAGGRNPGRDPWASPTPT